MASFDARGAAQALKAAIARGDVDVGPLYGGTPGGARIGCPLHGGDGPNFELYDDGRWRCHSRCGSGGDVFDFVAVRDMNVVAGTPLRGNAFAEAVQRAFDLLAVDLEAYGCARSPVGPKGKGKGKPYPPAQDVSRLLAFAHELPCDGAAFEIGGRARPGVGTNAVAAGLDLCVVLGDDVKKHRPKWAARWPSGKLFALYDHAGALATVHLRPDDESKGKGKNPARYNPAAFLMNAPMRALVRGESKAEQDRAKLLGYETARDSARAGVLVTEGPPAWCTWSRWHAGPVGAVCGQEPSVEWMRRIPKHVPVLLDFDPDLVGFKYLQAALRGLVNHEDVRLSARMRWIVDRHEDAKRNPDAVASALEQARKAEPQLLDPDELADGPRLETAGFAPIGAEERVLLVDQGAAFGAKWTQQLRTNDEGKVVASEGNLLLALKHDERWLGVIGRDERSDQVMVLKKAPVPDMNAGSTFPREFRDEDASHIGAFYEHELGIEFKNAAIHRAIGAVASLNSFDRVREYLTRVGAAWDGKPRLDTWLVDALGAEDTPLVRAVGAKWMISGVARTFQPGCKADYVLVLEGDQGAGKSTCFAALCPESPLFTDAVPDLQREKAAAEIITSGVWICELPELDSTARADVSAVKAFLTRREEKFRPAYGRNVRTRPRRVIFGASTNEGSYLRDQTGNRRFWPVKVGATDVERLVADRDQLWAEAVVRYRRGETWYLDDPRLEREAKAEQEARREVDPWEPPIVSYLESWRDLAEQKAAAGGQLRVEHLPGDCLEKLEMSVAKTTLRDQRRVNAILRAVGWDRVQRRDGEKGKRRWAWEPTEAWLSSPDGDPSPGFGGMSPGQNGKPGDGKTLEIPGMSPASPGVTRSTRARDVSRDLVSTPNGHPPENSRDPLSESGDSGDAHETIEFSGERHQEPGDSAPPFDPDDDGWSDEKCAWEASP